MKLKGKGNYANFDSHVAFVSAPKTLYKGTNFFPIRNVDDEYEFTELVTFQAAASLPRYLVELIPRYKHPALAKSDSKRNRDS
jgi:hypothetical protein